MRILIGGGFLCDACQRFGLSPGPQALTGPAQAASYGDQPVRPRFVDPMALGAAALVVMLGLIAFIEWPKLQKAMSTSVASAEPPTKPYADGADDNTPPQQAPVQQAARSNTGLPAPQTGDTQTASIRKTSGAPALVQPVQHAVDTSTYARGNEQQAAQSLNAFLNDYCGRRAAIVGQTVKTTTVTWWPFGAGVLVEFDEGGQYRQGSAQFTPKAGWAWLIRPDTMASTNSN